MEFKIGYKVKPKEINVQNQVIYEKWATDGEPRLIETTPTQDDCEAYGFIWTADERCFCYPQTTEGKPSMTDNISHTAGARNQTQQPSNQLSYVGLDNLIMNECFNDLVVGNNNNLAFGVDNTITSGTQAYATAANSIVQGGNEGISSENIERIQADSNTDIFLNNITDNYFKIPDNTAMFFNAEILAVRVGGEDREGAVGDFYSCLERGVIINKGGDVSISRTRKTLSANGNTEGWLATAKEGTDYFYIRAKGGDAMDVKWASTIRFTEIRTNVDLTGE